jgi:hypothetical protein
MNTFATLGWKVLGIVISLLSASVGVVFASFVFSQRTDPWAMSTTAMFTFGLFGLPSTLIFLLVGALMTWFGPSSWSSHHGIVHWVSTIGWILCYFIQWQLLAWKCFGTSNNAA